MFGSGFRANATIGRAIRLTAINAFGLRPHELDQATQGNPAKYTACIAENEEQSPWAPFHVEHGFDADQSTVTALTMRSVVHIEARHTTVPEQLALDLADTIRRTGALIHETISACIVLGPEHAELFAHAGWGKDELRRFVYEHSVNSRDALAAVGKDAVSGKTRWRLSERAPRLRSRQRRRSRTGPGAELRAGGSDRRRRRSQQRRVGRDRDLRAARRTRPRSHRSSPAPLVLKVDPLAAQLAPERGDIDVGDGAAPSSRRRPRRRRPPDRSSSTGGSRA